MEALQAQGTVGANMVVGVAPVSQDDAGFAQPVKQFAVTALDPERAGEALGIAPATVGPGATRIDVDRFDLVFTEAIAESLGR